MENFDVLDCTGRRTGEIVSRDTAHQSGVWHGAFHCLLTYQRDGKGYALFQKRSAAKKIAPALFDVSVGGHYATGEDAAAAGPREIREELGLDIDFGTLVPLGRRVFVYCFTPGVREYEFQDVFLLPKAVEPQKFTLQREEVEGVLEAEIALGVRLFSGQAEHIRCTFYRPDRTPEQVAVFPKQFVPCLDNYYLKLLILAQRYLSGDRKLLLI